MKNNYSMSVCKSKWSRVCDGLPVAEIMVVAASLLSLTLEFVSSSSSELVIRHPPVIRIIITMSNLDCFKNNKETFKECTVFELHLTASLHSSYKPEPGSKIKSAEAIVTCFYKHHWVNSAQNL
jgi:hypothetical protein